MLRKILLIFGIFLFYFIYANNILKPETLTNFSLIDDGQLIKYGIYLKPCVINFDCAGFKKEIIGSLPDVGLSRATSWLTHGLLYQGSAINPVFQHSLRVYAIGALMILVFLVSAITAGATTMPVIIGSLLFFSSFSFSENLIRLGPIEPYMVIWLGIFSVFFLNLSSFSGKRKTLFQYLSLFSLIFFLLLKEASIAILPVIFVSGIIFPKATKFWKLVYLVVFAGGVYFLVKYILASFSAGSDYAQNYILNPSFIIKNSINYLSLLSTTLFPFFDFSLLVIPFVLAFKNLRKKELDMHLVYWLLTFLAFTAILSPWKYVFDRYLLVSIYAFCLFFTILLSRLVGELVNMIKPTETSKIIFHASLVLAFFNLFFLGASKNLAKTINYRNWFGIFTKFESDQVKAIAEIDETVNINAKDTLDNWEVSYEIPMHLKYFYENYPEIKMLGKNHSQSGYIFTRSYMDLLINQDELSDFALVESGEYDVAQIDEDQFSKKFRMRPIQSLLNPPLAEGISFYWEIRKMK